MLKLGKKKELVHFRHFRDGLPLCYVKGEDLTHMVSSINEHMVTCHKCLDIFWGDM